MPSRKTIDEALEEAADRLSRVTALEAYNAMREGAVLVDTRSPDQPATQGYVAGAVHHPLSTLPGAAAAQLKEIAFAEATDVIGGVAAWKAAGLPSLGQADQIAVDANKTVAG